MSKVSEAYLSYMYDKEPLKKGKPRPRRKREKPQVEGQMALAVDESGELYAKDTTEERRKEQYKQDCLAYYDAFYEMLRRYGKFNTYYCLWAELSKDQPAPDAIMALNYHYDGSPDNVKSALERSQYWLGQARFKFRKAADKVDLFEAESSYDEAYRDADRRTKFYSYIRRERKKIESGKTSTLFTPRDFEDNYQRNRTLSKKKRK